MTTLIDNPVSEVISDSDIEEFVRLFAEANESPKCESDHYFYDGHYSDCTVVVTHRAFGCSKPYGFLICSQRAKDFFADVGKICVKHRKVCQLTVIPV